MKTITTQPFAKFDNDWALVTAGSPSDFNTMTVSWGSMGTVWGRSVITVYIRPDRYTWKYLKENDSFTVSFYPEKYRSALELLGSVSGRDGDKVKQSGLTPQETDNAVTFAEAEETYVCEKIYMAEMKYEDVPPFAQKIYQNGIEPHYIVMGEVKKVIR